MSVSKILNYTSIHSNGNSSDSNYKLKLNVLDKSGNYVLHKDFVRQLGSKRNQTASTKTRGEVRGGGRKPWRQKGTGRARAGSNRSPLWKGGGVVFGPKPKKSRIKTTKKERRLSLQTLLYNKKLNTLTIKDLEKNLAHAKTKNFLKICQDCSIDLNKKVLVVVSEKTLALKRSTRNLRNVEVISAQHLNTLSLAKANQIILTSLAINIIKENYCE